MKKNLALSLIIVLVFFGSCDLMKVKSNMRTGSIRLTASINGQNLDAKDGRVIRPSLDFELRGFDWILTGPGGQVKEFKNTSAINDTSMETGDWDVHVEGRNSNGILLASGSAVVTIVPVQTTDAVIKLELLSGKGSLKLEISWPPGILVDPSVVATLEKITENIDGSIDYGTPSDLQFSLLANASGSLHESAGWDSGFYVASIRLLESGETTWGVREAVYIVKDEISVKSFSIPGASLKSRPRAPESFVIRNYGSDEQGKAEVELSWNDVSDNEAVFVLERKKSSDEAFVQVVTDIPMGSTRYVDRGLERSNTYEYRLASKNMWGTSEYTAVVKTAFPDIVEVRDAISSDQNWTQDHSYVLYGNIRINSGVRLTIEPGTLVKFSDYASLEVQGTLVADGISSTSNDPIVFSPERLDSSPGAWGGVVFSGEASSSSVVRNCTFSNGSHLKFLDSYPQIEEIRVTGFQSRQVETWNENDSTVFFSYQNGRGSEAIPYVVKGIKAESVFNGIRVDIGSAAVGQIEFVDIEVANSPNRAMKIQNLSREMGFVVKKSSFKNSTYGIVLEASNERTIIEACGFEGNSTVLNVSTYGNAPQSGTVRDSTFKSNHAGIYLNTSASQSSVFKVHGNIFSNCGAWPINASTGSNGVEISGNRFSANNDGIYINGSSLSRLDSNTFQGNYGGWDLRMQNAVGLKASYNYWGTNDAAIIQSRIYDKRDDSSLGEVQYSPYFQRPAQYLRPLKPTGAMLVTEYELQFTWASYKRPEKVEFVLAKNATMSDIVHTVQGDFGFAYSLPGNVRDSLESDKTYYWKVGAIDQEGTASFGELNTFTLSQPGTSIDLIQFEEDVAIESLPEKAYIGKTYQVQAVSTKAADRYRWTLGAELLQDGASDTLMLKASDLGPGNYLLTVKAYFGNRHVSATRNFSVDSIKALDAWANAYATIVRRNDGTLTGFGNRYWLGGTIQAGATRVESPDFDFTDYQGYQDCYFWLRSDGSLWAAGVNYSGELGIGTSGSWEWSLKKVTSDVVQFSIGGRDMAGIFGLVLKRDGKVYAWGENGNGQLGTGSTARKNSPTLVPLEKKAVQVSAGIYHSYALLEDGTVAGWGNNGMGALGPRPSNQSDTFLSPRIIPRLTSVKSVFAGFYNGFFLLDSGRLVAMGHNRYGNLGIGQDWGNYETPQPISIPESVVRFASYEDTTFALTESGVLYVWGQNYEGMSGLGQEYGSVNSPRYLAEGIVKFGIGRRHSWYIDRDGAFWVWGSNSNWQLGDATSSAYRPMVIGW